jgi:hypothetical protein
MNNKRKMKKKKKTRQVQEDRVCGIGLQTKFSYLLKT